MQGIQRADHAQASAAIGHVHPVQCWSRSHAARQMVARWNCCPLGHRTLQNARRRVRWCANVRRREHSRPARSTSRGRLKHLSSSQASQARTDHDNIAAPRGEPVCQRIASPKTAAATLVMQAVLAAALRTSRLSVAHLTQEPAQISHLWAPDKPAPSQQKMYILYIYHSLNVVQL